MPVLQIRLTGERENLKDRIARFAKLADIKTQNEAVLTLLEYALERKLSFVTKNEAKQTASTSNMDFGKLAQDVSQDQHNYKHYRGRRGEPTK